MPHPAASPDAGFRSGEGLEDNGPHPLERSGLPR